jgi:uncharacterized membrane protein YdcZ (DUF606 family)
MPMFKPDKVIVGKYLSLDATFNLQLGLSVVGILIGFFLSYHFGNLRLGYIFLSATALLWLYYSVSQKVFPYWQYRRGRSFCYSICVTRTF